MDNYAIELLHITKVFPGIVANDDITLRVRYGEIHALLGENGAGKSTLMSVLFGLYQPEEGEILVNGKKAEIKNPRTANALGIGMVHQHFMLVQNFTVLENIVLGVETAKHGVLQMEEARKKVLALSERYGLNIDCDARVSDITVGMQQRVEILKMLYKDNNILIFDEPTAVLTPQEIDELMIIMQNLKREGKAIIFITHKLNEIKAVSDYCTVLRRGKCIGTCDVSTASVEDLSEMMVGRKIDFHLEKAPEHAGDAVLTLENVTLKSERNPNKNILNQVSFSVHKGEILCVAGIEGNGQSELVRVIVGLLKQNSGKILLNGEDVSHAPIRYRNVHGLAHVPEDRLATGLSAEASVTENLLAGKQREPRFSGFAFCQRTSSIERYASELYEKFDIRGAGTGAKAGSMSGGNMQKVVIAREFSFDAPVLLIAQPTRGVDVGAIEFIHARILEKRNEGCAILLCSADLDEVFRLSDRVITMYEGRITGEFSAAEISREEIGYCMTGGRREEAQA